MGDGLLPRRFGARLLFFVYADLLAVHLLAQLIVAPALATFTQAIAMPVLALALFNEVTTRGPLVWFSLLALGFSWLGDLLPRFVAPELQFILLMGCFLMAQIAYIVAFSPYWRDLRRCWPALIPLMAAFGVLVVATVPYAGDLLGPMLAYGVTLLAMVLLSGGVHPLTGVGGALFLLSDALIAMNALGIVDFTAVDFVIMATYLLAQAAIVLGVASRARAAQLA
ncbi:lysoplasmalogenase [Epidermidibacterium keratini]|uniref:Lysoplasmalogenase n=1 Tax=Epidermidibacterium keratini TaxID=1891644 RepID=A0A7L4YND6_9ACTN|nr:lysoplasmalogenase [Epidermidibacterium keratini]QHC00364.1 lysoplasmalogenase [Epidermidibacterium keratini]